MNTESQPCRADRPLGAGPEMSYIYAIGRVDEPTLRDLVARLTGVDGRPLRLVDAAGLEAVVSSVPSGPFGEQGLREQLEDMARLEEVARSHHAVVDAATTEATVLPMRLATVYLDDARAREMLTAHQGRFLNLLERLDGHVELGLKVYVDTLAVTPPKTEAETEAASAAASPGRAYLQRRRAQRRSIQDLYRVAAGTVEEAVRVAEGLSRARAVHRPQQGELAAARGENIANEAYLVPAAEVGRFVSELGSLADAAPGVHIEVTGPWAPYSFATTIDETYGTEEGVTR
ncbi:GvpL/GvpF family gas vesicle protein [Streptomyces exfoliatus]|uniref:GvpL/GvpF family gas vesicle protein n=1 Tax=Streptomyces exfoliatus TaxID=1905 RepID=UPI003C2B46FD